MLEWSRIEWELTRERGLWGPDQPSPLDKWMLDTVEGQSLHVQTSYTMYAYVQVRMYVCMYAPQTIMKIAVSRN